MRFDVTGGDSIAPAYCPIVRLRATCGFVWALTSL